MGHQPPRLVAWASTSNLLAVKAQFYPNQPEKDQRREAVNQVKAWLTRDRIPHAIESTMQLTEAVLQDSPAGTASNLTLQLSYSTAICRFVNGLLDPAQKSHFALPMHTLALSLGLPSSFVEIRHAATHESLPSLPVLRKACTRALNWLWENFWQELEGPIDGKNDDVSSTFAVGRNRGQELRARMLARQWVKLHRRPSVAEGLVSKPAEQPRETIAITKDCVSLCNENDGIPVLVDAILESDEQVPPKERQVETVKSATRLWKPLIETLDSQVLGFAEQLATSVLQHLEESVADEYKILDMDVNQREAEYKDAVYTWLENAISSSLTTDGRQEIIKNCILIPSKWSIRLAKSLIKGSHSAMRRYSNAIATTEQLIISQITRPKLPAQTSSSSKRPIGDVSEELDEFEARIEAMKAKRMQWEKSRSEAKSSGSRSLKKDGNGDDMDVDNADGQSSVTNAAGFLGTDASKGNGLIAGRFRKASAWKHHPIGAVI